MAGRAPDTLTRTGDWADNAACHGRGGLFFSDGKLQKQLAKTICQTCPVREACLADAMEWESIRGHSQRFGVYGGLDSDERAELAAGLDMATGRKPADCPSEAAYNRHIRLGEPIDDGCRRAHRDAARAYTAMRKAAAR